MRRILIAGLPEVLTSWIGRRLGDVSVRAARDSDEALAELARGGWSLLVVDHSVIGPAAVEVLSRKRAESDRVAPPILYCLRAGAGDDLPTRLVEELGVSRLLFHPLDREELAREIAATLGLPPPPREPDERAAEQQSIAAVAGIWAAFKPAVVERLEILEHAAAGLLEGTLDDDGRWKARLEAHKLVGSLGTVGFAEGSRVARQIEHAFATGAPASRDEALGLSASVAALRRELERDPVEQASEHGPDPVPSHGRVLLLVVDDDTELAERLATEAAAWGMRAVVAADPPAARATIARERPDVVLLDLLFLDGAEDGLTLLAELTDSTPPVPVLVLTVKDKLTDRVEVARLGGRGFLQKPLPSSQVLDAVSQLLNRLRAGEPRVLAVDDDPQVLAALRALLEPRGIQVTTLDDPLRFWQQLEESSPDLLVFDVDMPHLSGIELCRVVRNDPRWGGLPVVFLTAHQGPDIVHRVFAAGADDYVSKPIVGPELVTRVLNRLERVRLHRSMAETDPLTGVANRRKSSQDLGQLLRLAARHDQPLCLAVLDLDHFKRVNDRYGHPAGDAVLRRIAELLTESFRGDDVVARWGGEEFVVGMYGMTRADGVRRVSGVLETLRQEEHTAPDRARFRLTFSAGVAEYPVDGADLQALYRVADHALYQAKAAGRDRVLPAGWRPEPVRMG